MAKDDCMTDALHAVQMGITAVEALGTLGVQLSSFEMAEGLAEVLYYVGTKLTTDMARLDGLVCESGVLGREMDHA